MEIKTFIPFELDGHIENCYNSCMETLKDDDSWGIFIDHDAMFTTVSWYKQFVATINTNPEYACFAVYTNRVGNEEQILEGVDSNNHDICYHREIGKRLQKNEYNYVEDITNWENKFSGVAFALKKSAWKDCPFEQWTNQVLYGVDNMLHNSLKAKGYKIGLAKGIYVYHWYRADIHSLFQFQNNTIISNEEDKIPSYPNSYLITNECKENINQLYEQIPATVDYVICENVMNDYEHQRCVNRYFRDWTLVYWQGKTAVYYNDIPREKVLIAMPIKMDYTIDDETTKFCATSIKNGWHWLKAPSIEPTLARLMMTAWFLHKPEFKHYTHIFYLDADTTPPFAAIERLLLHNKDVVTAVTPIWLQGNLYMNVQANNRPQNLFYQEMPADIFEIDRVGGSALLVKRNVLEKLEFPYWKIKMSETIEELLKIGNPMVQGSDYNFCDKIKDAGFSIYADPTILCSHYKKINLLTLI